MSACTWILFLIMFLRDLWYLWGTIRRRHFCRGVVVGRTGYSSILEVVSSQKQSLVECTERGKTEIFSNGTGVVETHKEPSNTVPIEPNVRGWLGSIWGNLSDRQITIKSKILYVIFWANVVVISIIFSPLLGLQGDYLLCICFTSSKYITLW